MARSSSLILVVAGCLLGALGPGCFHAVDVGGPVEADRAAEEIWTRQDRLESYRFHLKYHTTTPFSFGAEFNGTWEAPDRERWEGTWWRLEQRDRTALVGVGDVQYEQEGNGWTRVPRGLETRIREQARQVFRGTNVKPLEQAGGRYRFGFTPWLPLLDPGRIRSFSGVLEVDADNGLPLSLVCTDALGAAAWELHFSSFNRAGRVRVPFSTMLEAGIAPDRRVAARELDRSLDVVRRRFEVLGWQYRLNRRWGRLVLQLDRAVPRGRLELLLSAGSIEVRTGRRVGHDEPPGDSILIVGGDAAFRVVPGAVIAANGDFSARTELELLPEPKLSLALDAGTWTERAGSDDVLLLFLLDGEVLDASSYTGQERLEFGELGSRETVQLLAAVASTAAAGTGFTIAALK